MSNGRVLKRANPGTIQDKFLVGYQGWFTCGGDGPPIGQGHHGWLHWVNEPLTAPFAGRPNTDLWPDTSAYDASELYPVAGLSLRNGEPAKVFSSRDPRTVRRHFRWMAEHGVDGAFLQRFVGMVDPEEAGNRNPQYGGTRKLRDEVGKRVREAAEAEGRVWAIMYDVSGVPASSILRIMQQDIAHLAHDERIFDSPAYLRERGRPVVAVWGFGLSDSPVPPHTARAVFDALRSTTGEDLYIFAGVPSHWRQPGAGDAHADPAFSSLWLGADGAVDALSPWSVGRYGNIDEVERWAAERWGGDAEAVAAHNALVSQLGSEGGVGRRVDYIPVVLPGGSGFNLSEGKWAFNGIKRAGGKFLWAQVVGAKRLKGVRTMYGAMWDEYDEGTAFLPVVEKKRLLPENDKWPFLALDEDGYDVPADWYMRIAGFAAEALRSERRVYDSFPNKELQDYWGTRPRYEEGSSSSATAQADARRKAEEEEARRKRAEEEKERERERAAKEAQAQYDAWAEEQERKEREKEEMPPPAYSLEDDGPLPDPAPQPAQPIQPQQPQTHGVDALASDFGRTQIGAGGAGGDREPPPLPERRESATAGPVRPQVERPPLHPANPLAQAQGAGGHGANAGLGLGRAASAGVGVVGVGAGAYGAGAGADLGRASSANAAIPGAGGAPYQQQQHPAALRAGSRDSGPGPAPGAGYGAAGAGAAGVYAAGPERVASPEVQGQGQWGALPQGWQQQQNTGGSAGSASGSGYAYQQQQQHTGGSAGIGSAGGGRYPIQGQGAYQAQASNSPPPPGQGGPRPQWQQQNAGYAPPAGAPRPQQQQHTGGSASSSSSAPAAYASPPQAHAPYGAPPRPASAYPGQAQAQGGSSSYPGQQAQGGPPRPSTSFSSRPPPQSSLHPAHPQGIARPTTPGNPGAPYPAPGGGYPGAQSPPLGPQLGPHQSLAPRPESARPTTPGYGPPMGPPPQQPHSSYSNQYPSPNGPPPASYPGSSYNPHNSPPAPTLPSPDLAFPGAGPGPSPYASYQPPPGPPHRPSGPPYPSQQSFPGPGGGGYTPPPGAGPSFPAAGPSFPQGGDYYQQPQFPTAGGYSPEQEAYNYAPQAWVPGAGPPPMPHRPGSQPYPGYGPPGGPGYGGTGPSFPSAAAAPPPASGPFGLSMNSMDKIVGRRTREQLEGHVNQLADTSAKLLNKFR